MLMLSLKKMWHNDTKNTLKKKDFYLIFRLYIVILILTSFVIQFQFECEYAMLGNKPS